MSRSGWTDSPLRPEFADLRFPIGPHAPQPGADAATRAQWIGHVRDLPANLESAVAGLDETQLDTPYREGGWTIRQLVHHMADSHMNAYFRMKLALTESNPTLRPYDQDGWAALGDSKLEIGVSLAMVRGVHTRMVCLLEAMSPEDFERPMIHPDIGSLRASDLLDIYQWHGRHHLAHITQARARHGWG